MSNQLKTPIISQDTKILSFDLETNGLHGRAFAVGGVVMDSKGNILDEFTARARLGEKVDDWVKDNVLPAIVDMPITHDNYEQMREAFWQWYLQAKDQADYVLVNNGYPVEHRFLLDCQDADIEERYWQWYLQAKDQADYVLVNNGYPVEHRFLLDCQGADIEERYWQHPFPILELSSLLLMAEQGTDVSRRQLKKNLIDTSVHNTHHPLDDAKLAILLAFEAFRLKGKL